MPLCGVCVGLRAHAMPHPPAQRHPCALASPERQHAHPPHHPAPSILYRWDLQAIEFQSNDTVQVIFDVINNQRVKVTLKYKDRSTLKPVRCPHLLAQSAALVAAGTAALVCLAAGTAAWGCGVLPRQLRRLCFTAAVGLP